MGVTFIVAMGLYLLGFVVCTYVCVIADPETSPAADLLTRQLPDYFMSKLTQLVGSKTLERLGFILDYLLQIIYLVVVIGSWSIMFSYGYPWITKSPHVSNYHKVVGCFVFVLCMTSWRYACYVSPGFITSQTLARYDHYPYDHLLFVPNRICPTSGIPRLARSKYDRYSNVHVARFDHFCGWLHNPIGEENYRYFLLFLVVHVLMCLYGTIVTMSLFQGEIQEKQLFEVIYFNVATGKEFSATWFIVSQYLFNHHFYMAGVLLLMATMTVVLSAFLAYHVYITSRGMTTNEAVKWGQVKKWHKQELKRYQEAIKAGQVPLNVQVATVVVSDGDAGCTGGTVPVTENKSSENGKSRIIDPGPMPVNIYDLGFVENWKEVLFPRSLRPEAIDRWRRSLQKKSVPTKNATEPIKPKAS